MRHGRPWIVVAATTLIGLPAAMTAIGMPALAIAAEDADEGREAAITIIGSPSLIPEGSHCRITLRPISSRRQTVETTHEGTVVEASARQVVLSVTGTRHVASANSPGSKIPFANRLFRNVGIGASAAGKEPVLTIAAETIQSVECLGLPSD